jgi:GntR family transcriptional repressor for pyruvate dehydrogenase complex
MTLQTPELARIERTSIKDQTLDRLKRFILSANVKTGQRLPSERELAERLGVGRSSVREALKVLETVGLVEIRIGDGTYVTSQAGASFGRTLGFELAAWSGALMEIMDARLLIEVAAARAAAARCTDTDLAALQNEVERMEASIHSDPPTYLASDMQFHRLIGHATHNPLIAQVITNLVDMLERLLEEANEFPAGLLNEGESSHRAVLQALQQHNPDAAARAMHLHQKYAGQLWEALITIDETAPAA